MKKLLSYIAIVLSVGTSASMASNHRDCAGDYTVQGKVYGTAHKDVERAGVVLCKDYGKDDRVKGDRYAVILCHGIKGDHWFPQAGKIEKTHKYSTDTAAAELNEETGGLLKYTAQQIRMLPYVYGLQKQMFFLQDAKNPNVSVGAIAASCKKAKHTNLPHQFKEMDDACAVSVIELLRVATLINNGTLGKHQSFYMLEKRSEKVNGQPVKIKINGHYMRVFSSQLAGTKAVFSNIFNHNF